MGGTALGYLDLKTGRYHSDDISNLPLLEKAISDHLAASDEAAGSALGNEAQAILATADRPPQHPP